MAGDRPQHDNSSERRDNRAKDGAKVKPPFLEILGRQFSDKKASETSNESPSNEASARDSSNSWFPPWSLRNNQRDDQHASPPPNSSLPVEDNSIDRPSHVRSESDRTTPEPMKNQRSSVPRNMDVLAPFRQIFQGKKSPDEHTNEEVKHDKENESNSSMSPALGSGPDTSSAIRSSQDDKVTNVSTASDSNRKTGDDFWNRIADVIVPNRNKQPPNLSRPASSADSNSEENDAGKRESHDAPSKSQQATGVGELYKPPGDLSLESSGEKTPTENGSNGLLSGLAATIQKMSSRRFVGQKQPKTGSSSEESAKEVQCLEGGDLAPSEKKTEAPQEPLGDGIAHESQNSTLKDIEPRSPDPQRNSRQPVTSKADSRKPLQNGLSPPIPSVEISSVPQNDVAAIRGIFGSETFFATETLSPPGGLIFRGNLRGEPSATLEKLEKRLAERLGNKYTLCLAEGEEDLRPVVVVVPTARDRRPPTSRQRAFSAIILALTASTCYARAIYAYWHANEFWALFQVTREDAVRAAQGNLLNLGVAKVFLRFPFASLAIAIALVVSFSQVVQRFVAKRYKTRVGLPYYMPSYQLGSFGAIVQLASPTPTRASLFDIALSGAASLLIISVVLFLIGLRLSLPAGGLMVPVPTSTLSSSLAVGWLTRLVAGGGQLRVHPSTSLVGLHPIALVGVNCLTIAALNLLPIRQLDGGRIVSAIYGRKTAIIASRVTIFFLLLASSKSSYLFVFLALVLLGPWSLDRPAKNELTEPNAVRAVVGYIFLLMMLTILLPYPSHIPFRL